MSDSSDIVLMVLLQEVELWGVELWEVELWGSELKESIPLGNSDGTCWLISESAGRDVILSTLINTETAAQLAII